MEKKNNSIKTAVLSGGIGSERQVSLESGKSVAEALRGADFRVVEADIRPDRLDILDDASIDVFFPALHGQFGEDGQLQQIMQDKGLIYTGSGPLASRQAFDKMAAKAIFSQAGVATARATGFDSPGKGDDLEKKLADFGDKYVIKPIRQGSSVGVSIVGDRHQAVDIAARTVEQFGDCMIEEFVQGRELTVGILGGRALPIIEIRACQGFYDYHAKYVDEQTEFLFDTLTDSKVAAEIQTAAMVCFGALGCRHFGRIDFILGEDGRAYALEANTIPGFTNHSLLPRAAARAGLSMNQLCSEIVHLALSQTD